MTAFAKKMEKENCAGKLKASTTNSEKIETQREGETDRDLKAPPEAAKQTNRRTGRRWDRETDCRSDGD